MIQRRNFLASIVAGVDCGRRRLWPASIVAGLAGLVGWKGEVRGQRTTFHTVGATTYELPGRPTGGTFVVTVCGYQTKPMRHDASGAEWQECWLELYERMPTDLRDDVMPGIRLLVNGRELTNSPQPS